MPIGINVLVAHVKIAFFICGGGETAVNYIAATIGSRYMKAMLLVMKNSFIVYFAISRIGNRTKYPVVIINHFKKGLEVVIVSSETLVVTSPQFYFRKSNGETPGHPHD